LKNIFKQKFVEFESLKMMNELKKNKIINND